MIFGSVINENLTEEIIVTVIATGFNEEEIHTDSPYETTMEERANPFQREQRRQHNPRNPVERFQEEVQPKEKPQESLDIPAFLRNRKNRFR